MLRILIAVATILSLTASCSKKGSDDGGGSGEELGTTPNVETLQQPDAVTMKAGGEVVEVNNADDGTDEVPYTLDLRADAPKTAAFPALKSLDPRSYAAHGTYTPGGGKLVRSVFSGTAAVPDDGRSHILPACSQPFPAPGHSSTSGLTVDGNVGEWPATAVVAVDKGGDGANSPADIREVYFAKDATSMYLGVKVNGTVSPTGTLTQRIVFIFSQLSVPTDSTTTPGATQKLVLEAWGPQLKDAMLNPYPGSGSTYNLAVAGNSLELRLNLSVVESLMGGKPYTVEVTGIGLTPSSTWVRDNVGVHIVGITDDYACMVDMPEADGSIATSKMFVMRRTDPAITVSNAELLYRAMVHGSRASEYVAKDHMRHWDTVAYTAIKQMAPAGVNVSNVGIFVDDDIYNAYGEKGDSTYLTFVAAHEYLHSFNASDYQFPDSWMSEGHSNLLATRAVGS